MDSPSKIAKTCNLTVRIFRQNNDFAKCHYFFYAPSSFSVNYTLLQKFNTKLSCFLYKMSVLDKSINSPLKQAVYRYFNQRSSFWVSLIARTYLPIIHNYICIFSTRSKQQQKLIKYLKMYVGVKNFFKKI